MLGAKDHSGQDWMEFRDELERKDNVGREETGVRGAAEEIRETSLISPETSSNILGHKDRGAEREHLESQDQREIRASEAEMGCPAITE